MAARKSGFGLLPLGPGDSLFSALIAPVHGTARTYLVDAGDLAAAEAQPTPGGALTSAPRSSSRRPHLESYARRAGLDGQVVLTAFREDVAEVMVTFHIFAFVSLWEGLPQVMVQSAALGKPIVTFSVEGGKELIQDRESGYIVPLRDVRGFAERLHHLCESAALRHQMGKQIRERLPAEQ